MGNGVKAKKVTLNVYLLKQNNDGEKGRLWSDKELIARPLGSGGKPQQIKTEKHLLGPEGSYGTLYIRKPIRESNPEWLEFVRGGLGETVTTSKWTNKSVSALLVVEQDSRQFAIAFGYGRHLIEPRLIEDRFGIKVVLNSVSPDKIASIDRQTFDAEPKISRTQTIKAASVSDYLINPEQDLLRGLVGFTKAEYLGTFGTLVAGIDSFKTVASVELSGLQDLLKLALERAGSKDYLSPDSNGHQSEFSWVENLTPVKDRELIEGLEIELWKTLGSSEKKDMWLAVPDIVDWSNVTGFAYHKGAGDDEIDVILNLEKFLSTLRSDATLDTIKRREILMLSADGAPSTRFNAFKCLYAEVKHNSELFILNVGSWFKVEKSFQAAVEKYFTEIPRKPFIAPFVEYDHAGEGPYNEHVCSQAGISHAMLDRKLINFGGSYDKVEVCDIYKVRKPEARGEFIHVKRGRGSSTLSHLFAQGLVASTLMVKERKFVKDVNSQLTSQGIAVLPEPFEAKGNDVVYAIIDGPANVELDIPFFSKVTLQNCAKTIALYGYEVKLMHIPESAAYLTMVAQKEALKAAKKKLEKTGGKKASRSNTVGDEANAYQ